jgi:hypothetical protein
MATKTTFGTLKIGQCFSIGGNPDSKYINIKIQPAVFSNNTTGEPPFNCIALEDGRVRTISDNQKVVLREII